jgi:hypothetical protein
MPRDNFEKKVNVISAVMESRLQANEAKGDWNDLTPSQIIEGIRRQAQEAEQAVLDFQEGKVPIGKVLIKCADGGNYFMFLADKMGALEKVADGIASTKV